MIDLVAQKLCCGNESITGDFAGWVKEKLGIADSNEEENKKADYEEYSLHQTEQSATSKVERSKSMAFMAGKAWCGDVLVGSANGVWKYLTVQQ